MGFLTQNTQSTSIIMEIPSRDKYLISGPIAYAVVSEQVNDEAGSQVKGRHHHARGYATGNGTPLRQDTFLTGTSGRTGRAFDVVSGTWKSDSRGVLDTYRILMPDSTPGVVWEAVSHTTTPTIETANLVIGRGFPPVGSSAVYSKSNTYCYLHLCYGNQYDYRIALEYSQPIRLDRTTDGGATWTTVAVASKLGSLERFLAANKNEIPIHIETDGKTGEIWIEIGDGHWLHDAWSNSQLGADPEQLLPNPGKYRLVGSNGWVSLEVYPLRHSEVGLAKNAPLVLAAPHANAANARVVTNALRPSNPDQVVTSSVDTDGQQFTFAAIASLPDAGEGQGSAEAPDLSDMTLLIEEVWGDQVPDDYSIPSSTNINQMRMEQTQTLDDRSRTFTTSGQLVIQNADGRYTGSFGNMAIDVYAGADGPWTLMCSGIAGTGDDGVEYFRSDPTRVVYVPYCDKRVVMQVPLLTEVILDRWAWPAAVRWLARAGNIHPFYLQTIPYWPDGPAGPDCPYSTLAEGTGNNPKYRFTPEMDPWAILSLIVQDMGLPISEGVSLPFYMGFTPDGQFHFEPFDPLSSPPVALFTSYYAPYAGNPAVFPILSELEVYTSTAQLRSEVNLQGLNAWTYQLMQYHAETNVSVRKALGYRFPSLDRTARYSTPSYIEAVGDVQVALSSLPSQVVKFGSFFIPGLRAGMTILVEDGNALGRIGLFVITGIHSICGMRSIDGSSGMRVSQSVITARNVESYPSQAGFIF